MRTVKKTFSGGGVKTEIREDVYYPSKHPMQGLSLEDETIMPPWRALEIILELVNNPVFCLNLTEVEEFNQAETVLKNHIIGPQ